MDSRGGYDKSTQGRFGEIDLARNRVVIVIPGLVT